MSSCPPTRCGPAPRHSWRPSLGVASSGSASLKARRSTAWSRGSRGSSTTATTWPQSCSISSTTTPRSFSSNPGGCATAPRHPGRGGRPGPHAGPDLGGGRRRGGLPPAARRLRPAAGAHQRPGMDGHQRARGARRGHGRRSRLEPGGGRRRRPRPPARWAPHDGHRVVVAADGVGSADRLVGLLGDQGVTLELDVDGRADLGRPGGHVVVAPLERGFLLPASSWPSSPRPTSPVAAAPTVGPSRARWRPRATSTT